MKASLHIARYNRIPISIHWTFLLLLMWIIVVNFLSVSFIDGITWSTLLLLSLFASILAHEFGHAFAAAYFGYRASGIVLYPSGGLANIPELDKKPAKEMLVGLAGPAVNLIIAVVLLPFIRPYHAYWGDPENIGSANAGNFLFQLQVVNFSLGVFNLIPAYPMDGGGILKSILVSRLNTRKAEYILDIVSKIIAFGFILLGLIIVKLLLVLIGLFILFAAWSKEGKIIK